MTLTELIALFKDKPLDFDPGEKWSYSNSGYILLGAIIEKASGQTYQDFIEKQIFAPAGMTHSYYDRTDLIIAGRAQGYSKGRNGFVNCAYLSMTQPYAAGSLASSVDDLALWDAALYTEKLLKQDSLRRAWTSAHLNSGKLTHYGFGWEIGSIDGHPLIAHNGGIHGFATSALRIPDERIYVAILANLDDQQPSPDDLAMKVAYLLLGKPYKEPVPIELPSTVLDRYVGAYQLEGGPKTSVAKEGNRLFVTLGRKAELLPLSETEFCVKDSLNRISFSTDTAGRVTGLVLKTAQGIEVEATRVNKPGEPSKK
jgi:CubicO group peptidase (beta-lactamase class C family)